MPENLKSVELGHKRVGSLTMIDRSRPLPEICMVTGEKATRTVKVLFHWKKNTFGPSDPTEAIIMGLFFYLFDVPKATLRIPISASVSRRRTMGWLFTVLIAVVAVATCATLLIGQSWIDQLPKGDFKKSLNDFGVPGVAIGGFVIIASMSWFVHRTMPMLTVLLRVVEITSTHVTLDGASEVFLLSLEETPGRASLSPVENR